MANERSFVDGGRERAAPLVAKAALWFDAGDGRERIEVHAAKGVTWSAGFSSPEGVWVSFLGASSGTGEGTLPLQVAANVGAPRSGEVEITAGDARAMVSVLQLAAPLWYEQIVLSLGLPVIEQRALLGVITQINEAAPEARPARFQALYEGVAALEPAMLAIYARFPRVPQTYTPGFISREVRQALSYITERLSGHSTRL